MSRITASACGSVEAVWVMIDWKRLTLGIIRIPATAKRAIASKACPAPPSRKATPPTIAKPSTSPVSVTNLGTELRNIRLLRARVACRRLACTSAATSSALPRSVTSLSAPIISVMSPATLKE